MMWPMRWIYPANEGIELIRRTAVLQRIERFWAEFLGNIKDIQNAINGDDTLGLHEWMSDHLRVIDPRLSWECMRVRDEYHMLLTPQFHRHLRPLTDVLVFRAPRIGLWRYLTYRPPVPADVAVRVIQDRMGIDLSDITCAVSVGSLNTIDLILCSSAFKGSQDPLSRRQAYALAEAILGEESMEVWGGQLQSVGPSTDRRTYALDRLRPTAEALIGSIIDQLPDKPMHQYPLDAPRHYMELPELPPSTLSTQAAAQGMPVHLSDLPTSPGGLPDFPQQRDLQSATTQRPILWRAAHSGRPFFSEQFSRFGEKFCYVKIDGMGSRGGRPDETPAIQKNLNKALRDRAAGAAFGRGSGLRYGYVDLSLIDVQFCFPIIQSVLREANVGRRSWIMFYDADLQAEWIGIYPDSPDPLLAV